MPADLGRAGEVLLFAIRRSAVGGLRDAHAAQAMLGLFGLSHRRPLILLRALMAELARASARSIVVAPCCCPQMTAGEAALLRAISTATDDATTARSSLAEVLGTDDCLGAVVTAQALGQAFQDLGRPLTEARVTC